ncbi:10823_t:CDS:2 [Acaulospora colombiana]|uniref:10823_t:CDS:1 n=1 Tax=Acaulospora colombiana TaxID=27376 RepID=A0ACA9KD06_9GLOM|nr:10823_t:CDS:2 [Acaulospora colombiana]
MIESVKTIFGKKRLSELNASFSALILDRTLACCDSRRETENPQDTNEPVVARRDIAWVGMDTVALLVGKDLDYIVPDSREHSLELFSSVDSCSTKIKFQKKG